MFHYNKLKGDILNWDCVNVPSGNRDIDRFEENNKLVSINVFDLDDCLNDKKKSYYIEALKIQMPNMRLIY